MFNQDEFDKNFKRTGRFITAVFVLVIAGIIGTVVFYGYAAVKVAPHADKALKKLDRWLDAP